MKMLTASLLLALASASSLPVVAATPQAARFDADAAWTRFLSKTKANDVGDAYGVLASIGYDGQHVQADGCRTSKAALDRAVETVPVGLALRHARMLCAEATGDERGAEADLATLGDLVRHAMDRAGNGAWPRPVRIVRPEDIEAFAAASGYEQRYSFYGELHPNRYFPRTVAFFDRERGTERLIDFDWVDALVQLDSDGPLHGFPIDRYATEVAFVDAWAGDGDVASVDARALRDAWAEPDLQKRRDLLKAAAGRGGLSAAQGWLALCRERPSKGCADGLVDALLPSAEAGHSMARVTLAMAYLDGIGVKRDDAAARTLVESADRTWARGGASTALAAQLLARSKKWPSWLANGLEHAVADGSEQARALLLLRRVADGQPLADADRQFLESPRNNLEGRGLAVLAALAEEKDAKAVEPRERAAAAGDPASQRMVALRLRKKGGKPEDVERLLREAAAGGDVDAAWFLAMEAERTAKLKAAQSWLLPGVLAGDVDSQLALAALYASGADGLAGGPQDARTTYEELAATSDEAKRSLASMLVAGEGGPKDVVRARSLLEQLARAGDNGAQLMLAGLSGNGRFGKPDADEARRWFERAIAKRDPAALAQYGTWLLRVGSTPAEHRRGVELLNEGAKSDNDLARNNLAWALCVSPFDDVRDATRGLETAKALGDPSKLDAGTIDTVAACHAAAGEYPRAVELQAAALAATPDVPALKRMRERLQERLALYRSGKPYLETETAE